MFVFHFDRCGTCALSCCSRSQGCGNFKDQCFSQLSGFDGVAPTISSGCNPFGIYGKGEIISNFYFSNQLEVVYDFRSGTSTRTAKKKLSPC